MLTKSFVVCVPVVFCFFSFTAAHFYRVAGRWHFSFSHHSYEILMFFFQRNSSPLFLITRSRSFPVIHVNVDIKNNVEKDSTFLLFFFSLKVQVAMRFPARNTSSCLWRPRAAKMPAWLWPHCGNHLHACRSFEAVRTGQFTLWWVWRPKIEIRIATSAFVIDERWYVVFMGNHVNVQEFIA